MTRAAYPRKPVALLLGPGRRTISGVATHVSLLMASALAAEYRLEHFQVGAEGRDESLAGRLARFASSPFALAAAILRLGAEIVHINTSLNWRSFWRDLVYLLVAQACGARVVYQVHGGALRRFAAGWRWLVRGLLRMPDVAVVVSRAEHAAWREIVPGQRVVVVANGIDFLQFDRSRSAAHTGALELLYIGRLASGKGLPETVAGLALAREAGIDVRLTIAGAGPEEERLRREVAVLGLAGVVSFPGPAYDERKGELLAAADALVLASHSEGLPYSLLEGMAAGLVPVATPVGGIPDVVQPGVHGLLVPAGNAAAIAAAIGALARDRARLARMSRSCRERIAQSFSIERAAQDFGALYRKLEGGRPWAASPAG